MADLKKTKDLIRELAGRRKNVRLPEIERVINGLKANGFLVRIKENEHQKKFTVNDHAFSVCTHHSGGSQLKAVYVDAFIDAMINLGLYDE
jgi:hypothetical protein